MRPKKQHLILQRRKPKLLLLQQLNHSALLCVDQKCQTENICRFTFGSETQAKPTKLNGTWFDSKGKCQLMPLKHMNEITNRTIVSIYELS